MPTFTAIALDRLLEPGATGSPNSVAKPPNLKPERRHSSTETRHAQLPQLSPALYATPAVTPVPDSSSSSSSFPPSPYIINHKRRGPGLLKSVLNQQAPERGVTVDENGRNADSIAISSTDDALPPATVIISSPHKEDGMAQNGFHDEDTKSSNLDRSLVRIEDSSSNSVPLNLERDSECEDFFDPQDSMSISSNTDLELDNGGGERSFRLTVSGGEFYDAWEELSSDGGPQSSLRDMEAELSVMKLNLLTEIEKRKQAEEALNNMQKQWQRITEHLSLVGLTIPPASTIAEDENLDPDPGKELCQQIDIARMVSNSIGRGTARVEVEMEMESWVESKNFEIARLSDRLHYYEAVNHEMSQRNQEAVEVARRQRHRRKTMRRWVWSSIGAAVALGAVGLAWSYYPTGTESSCSMLSEALDGDDATPK